MMRSIKLAVSVVVLAALFALPSNAHGPKTRNYVGHFDPLTFGTCVEEGAAANVGKVCFPVNAANDNFVDIAGTDAVLGTPGLFYIFRDAAGNCIGDDPNDPSEACPGADFVCGAATNLSVPNATVKLDVYPLGVLGVIYCTGLAGSETVGASTTGTITAHFTGTAGEA